MNRTLACVTVVAAAAIAPAFAQKVYIDYDKDYDRTKVHTYAWGKTDSTLAQVSPMAHDHIVQKVETYLAGQGLQKVAENPDVFVSYHTNSKEELSVNTDMWGYGYPSSFYWNPYWGAGWGTTTTTVTSYTRGTLIVDVWDAKQKQLIWRGSATDIVPENPQKAYKKIDKAIEKMVYEWKKAKQTEEKERAKAEKKK